MTLSFMLAVVLICFAIEIFAKTLKALNKSCKKMDF